MRVPIEAIQETLRRDRLDGWLLFDFHGSNGIARQIGGIGGMVTRRWCLWVPASGKARVVHHRIEEHPFEGFPAEHITYAGWRELDAALWSVLSGSHRIAMEYSPDNAIPYIGLVDAGTIEKIRAMGIEVVSSADLVARFLAAWDDNQIAGHRRAATALCEIKNEAFAMIAEAVDSGRALREHDVVSFVRRGMEKESLVTDAGPICAVDANAGKPHYEPSEKGSAPIGRDQLVLLDLWAKETAPNAVYADMTWTAFTGHVVPERIVQVFSVVAEARDRAVEFINNEFDEGRPVTGAQVDDAVRRVISEAGYGEFFIHRTGHSIGTDVHGVGPNIDNLETQDGRRLQEHVCFSVEPGIYLPEFGIRSEIDVLIENGRAVVTTVPVQTSVVALLS